MMYRRRTWEGCALFYSPFQGNWRVRKARGKGKRNACFLTYSVKQSPSWEAYLFSASLLFHAFYGTRMFTAASQVPTSWRFILILSSHLRLVFPSGFFPSTFPNKTLYIYLSSPPHMLYAPHIWFSIWSPGYYWVKSRDHKAPHYVVFSTPLLPHPSEAQILSLAPYSQTPSAYVYPSMWATKFHTHTKQQAKLPFFIS